MSKVLIATFSQNGSTKNIADQIALGLRSSDCEVTNVEITGNHCPDLNDFDIIGIGTPTYFFRPPFIVMDFVRNLSGIENKSSFVFVMYGTHQGDCGNWIRRELRKKGTRELGYFKSHGADYWLGYLKRGVLFSHISPTEAEQSSAEFFGSTIALYFKKNMIPILKHDPEMPLMYRLEKTLVSRPFARMMYSKTFWTNKKCDMCGICIKKCPVGNIYENKKGKIKWQSKCMLCVNCELSCPKDAIHSAFDWKIFAPFMAYNISHSKRKNIPWINVVHKNGKTILSES
jgi:flavodoxin/NAD-dependent dihydropyrimidine dehydrogenase PreA subunit